MAIYDEIHKLTDDIAIYHHRATIIRSSPPHLFPPTYYLFIFCHRFGFIFVFFVLCACVGAPNIFPIIINFWKRYAAQLRFPSSCLCLVAVGILFEAKYLTPFHPHLLPSIPWNVYHSMTNCCITIFDDNGSWERLTDWRLFGRILYRFKRMAMACVYLSAVERSY